MQLHRSYFALQATFAARVAEIADLPLGEACRLHTTFYAVAKDNDAGVAPERNDFDSSHPAWAAFLQALDDGVDPVDHVYDDCLRGDAQNETGRCFEFTYWPEDHLVRVHFGNDGGGTGLRDATVTERRRELRSIFRTVTDEHPDARVVRGTSWLYHLEAYRRLFPPSFVAGLESVGHPHQFAALWAQFLDRHGVVKPHLAEPFLAAVERSTSLPDLDRAFPLDVLATTGDVEASSDFYET